MGLWYECKDIHTLRWICQVSVDRTVCESFYTLNYFASVSKLFLKEG